MANVGVADDDDAVGLHVTAGGGAAGGIEDGVEHFVGDGVAGEGADGAVVGEGLGNGRFVFCFVFHLFAFVKCVKVLV